MKNSNNILPIIVDDNGTHFQIYNPRNLDTYFVDKDDFFSLLTGKRLNVVPKSYRYIGVSEDQVAKGNELMRYINELNKEEKVE